MITRVLEIIDEEIAYDKELLTMLKEDNKKIIKLRIQKLQDLKYKVERLEDGNNDQEKEV